MRRSIAIVSILLTAAIAAIAAAYLKEAGSPHDFTQSDCFFCHYTIPREGEPLRFTDGISSLCARCHDMSKSVSHQVDMIPSQYMSIPADMPLDEDGRMTCVTCHDVHKAYKNPLTGDRTYFLRRDTLGKNFCLACHNQDETLQAIRLASTEPISPGGRPTPLSHRPAMNRGHGFANFEVLDPATALDPLSLACLDCHNEPGQPGKTSLGAGIWRHAKEGIGLSHPVGVDYRTAANDNKDLVPVEELDKRLKLFNGKIGCCTCHDPYAPGDGQGLVIGTQESYHVLCLSCHIK